MVVINYIANGREDPKITDAVTKTSNARKSVHDISWNESILS